MHLGRPWLSLDWRERIFAAGSGTFGMSLVRFEEPYWAIGFHPSGGQWSVSLAKTRLVVDWEDDEEDDPDGE